MSKKLYFLLISLFIFSGCVPTVKNRFARLWGNSQEVKQGPPITIWVHGTKMFFSKYFFNNFFHSYPGLNPAAAYEQKYHLREIAHKLCAVDPDRFIFDAFYFYGWSGKLSFEAREQAAKNFYEELKEVVEQYRYAYNHEPFIRIITHSHGGNVVLHLAEVKDIECDFVINELIMLAVPVQERTVCLTKDPLFEKIYSIYSTLDTVQVMDPQGFHHWYRKKTGQYKEKVKSSFFSGRTFPEQDNLLQIKLKLNRRGMGHVEFLMNHFIKNIPMVLDRANKWFAKTKQTKLFLRLKS